MEAGAFQTQLRNRMAIGLAQRIDLDDIWAAALAEALSKMQEMHVIGPLGVHAEMHAGEKGCPVGFDELCADEFDPVVQMANLLTATLR